MYITQTRKIKTMEKEILSRLEAIEQYSLLAAKAVLTIADAALLTGLSKSHLYKLTCTHQIPHYKPNGKLLYFDRKDLENWMKQGKINTTLESEQQAAAYLVAHPTPTTTRRKGGAK